MEGRTLWWDGLVNGRDMGGVAIAHGQHITPGRLLRSASPHHLTPRGWRECVAYGVRSTLDLRHSWEIAKTIVPGALRPIEVTDVTYSLEPAGFIDAFQAANEGWKLATPVYYDDFVTTSPGRIATAVRQLLAAPRGGVLVHCSAGRDRAGLFIAIVLDLLGADRQDIIEDHWRSFDGGGRVETTLQLAEKSGGLLPLQQDEHAKIMSTFLNTSPSVRVFGDQTDEVRANVLARLL